MNTMKSRIKFWMLAISVAVILVLNIIFIIYF